MPQVATETVTVTEGGARTWWDLAAAHLGDGAAWRQLWDLNHGRVQADGTTLSTERDVLQPGWTILVPATAAPSVTAVAAARHRTGDRWAGGHRQGRGHPLADRRRPRRRATGRSCGRSTPTGPSRMVSSSATRTTSNRAGRSRSRPARPRAADTATGAADNAADMVVTVAPGDTLSQIAADHGTDTAAVLAVNLGVPQPDGGC